MRALGVAIAVLAATPALALSYVVAGSFTPHSATDELSVFFGAVDTSGFPPNPLGFGVT